MFIAINTTEVGVETFSETRNSKLRIEKEQMSTPLPVIAEKIPPRKPVRDKTPACQIPNIGIESNVILLCCLKISKKNESTYHIGKNNLSVSFRNLKTCLVKRVKMQN